jgi:integrase
MVGGEEEREIGWDGIKVRSCDRALHSVVGAARAGINLRQILPRDVLRFREGEVGSGKHPGTCNDYLGIVGSAFGAARKQGLITHNPAEAVERLRNESEASRRPFTLKEIQSLLRADEGDWHGAILLALYTGMRLNDAANLKWESIDLNGRWISYRASKTRTRHKIPMHDALRRWLKKQIRNISDSKTAIATASSVRFMRSRDSITKRRES